MTDELLQQLCPIQFIEGINENQKSPAEKVNQIQGNAHVSGFNGSWAAKKENAVGFRLGIPYSPGRAYTLSRIEIYCSENKLSKQKEHFVGLCTSDDSDAAGDVPSDNLLTHGKLVIPSEAEYDKWLQVQLLQPIVMFTNQLYWIVLEVKGDSLGFAFRQAQAGREINPLMDQTNKKGDEFWQYRSHFWGFNPRPMLKFYGRVLPVLS